MFIVIIGVSGSGKTTIGKLVAEKLKASFLDADDYHDAQAIAMMRDNIPLSDTQRIPWIKRLIVASTDELVSNNTVVLGYSGLKRYHREMFRTAGLKPKYFWLDVPRDTLTQRLTDRSGHFVGAEFLEGQLAAFESPLEAELDIVNISAKEHYGKIVSEIANYIKQKKEL